MSLKTKTTNFLNQKRIAVAGVRSTQDDAANGIFRKLRDEGYTVFAVNPSVESVEGETCYPNVQSIPGGVEGVVIVTSPKITEQVVRDCVDANVRSVWMHKSMGNSVSEEAVKFAEEHGIEVIAGACPMMYCNPDIFHRCMRWMMGVTGGLPN